MSHPRVRAKETLRLTGAFSLLIAWFVLLPRLALAHCPAAHQHAFAFGCGFAVLLAVVAALDAALAKPPSAKLFLYAIMAAAAGFAFLLLSEGPLRLICLGVELAGGMGLLFVGGRALGKLAVRELYFCVLGSIAAAAVLRLFATALDFALWPAENAQAPSNLMLAVLALAPLASALLGKAPKDHREAGGSSPPEESELGRRREAGRRPSKHQDARRIYACIIILSITSLISQFAVGFTHLPHRLDWNSVALLQSLILLVIVLSGTALLLRRSALRLLHTSYFTLISLFLAIAGFSMPILAHPFALLASRGMLVAAWDCSFCSAFVLLCHFIQTRRRPFGPILALGILGTGTLWGYGLGIVVKPLLGQDMEMLASVSATCALVLTLALFLLFARSQGSANRSFATEGEEGLDGPVESAGLPDEAFNASPPRERACVRPLSGASCDQAQPAPPETPLVDAAMAHKIIEHENASILASYKLSPRELQVSLLMLDGCTAAAASESLGISVATVKFHLGNAYRKIGIQSKSELMDVVKDGGQKEESGPASPQAGPEEKTGEAARSSSKKHRGVAG